VAGLLVDHAVWDFGGAWAQDYRRSRGLVGRQEILFLWLFRKQIAEWPETVCSAGFT
jgi:hypothetical protein